MSNRTGVQCHSDFITFQYCHRYFYFCQCRPVIVIRRACLFVNICERLITADGCTFVSPSSLSIQFLHYNQVRMGERRRATPP